MGHQGSLQRFGRFGSHACFFFHFFSLFIVMLGCDVQGWRWLYHNSTRTTLSESTGGHAMPLIFTPPFNFAASIVKVNGVSLCSTTLTGNQRERRYWWEWGTRVLFKVWSLWFPCLFLCAILQFVYRVA
ncbi:hypothetical protein B0O80DRAFT_246223 [Mortierella sp. GBAus27b]|nr:hypothetical protein B0O80DRAFT_246223 [Mortierella sp. GBAus27b]